MRSVGGVLMSLSQAVITTVTHGQCDIRPTVTFQATGHHRPLTGTKLYHLVTKAMYVYNLPKVVT